MAKPKLIHEWIENIFYRSSFIWTSLPILMVVKIIRSTVLDPYIAEVQIICQSKFWPQGYKTFLCSTQLSMKFQLLIKTKIPTNEKVSCFQSLR